VRALHAFLILLGLGAAAGLGAGCAALDPYASRLVTAPNQQFAPRVVRDAEFRAKADRTYTDAWMLTVPGCNTQLSIAVIEPNAYQLNFSPKLPAAPGRLPNYTIAYRFPDQLPEPLAARGTVVLLHGVSITKESMIPWALRLAEEGYRAVLVDLRGHGRSSGDQISFGARETGDLSALLDELQARGLLEGQVGMMGVSYGASMSLLLAGRDPRVGSVVALEPFASAPEVIPGIARSARKELKWVPRFVFGAAISRAQSLGGFRWTDLDVGHAIERSSAPLLFVHGSKDQWIPPEHSQQLARHSPAGSRVIILDGEDHFSLALRLDHLGSEVVGWFDRTLNPAAIAAARTPPEPTVN
jgi:pimeloyl-ACP methyl ester carboxylesterase